MLRSVRGSSGLRFVNRRPGRATRVRPAQGKIHPGTRVGVAAPGGAATRGSDWWRRTWSLLFGEKTRGRCAMLSLGREPDIPRAAVTAGSGSGRSPLEPLGSPGSLICRPDFLDLPGIFQKTCASEEPSNMTDRAEWPERPSLPPGSEIERGMCARRPSPRVPARQERGITPSRVLMAPSPGLRRGRRRSAMFAQDIV